ncbi:MAG: msfA [Rickettsiaceae bacterium]|jgi:TPR repeat protein|nr:msfA [Rickettsiaceae bacterium]
MKLKLEPNSKQDSKKHLYKTKEDAVADFAITLKEIAEGNLTPDIISRLEQSQNTLLTEHELFTHEFITIIKNNVNADSLPALLKKVESIPNDTAELNFSKGFLYNNGVGTPESEPNIQKAKEYYLKAAEKDYVPAQNNLAAIYCRGQGEPGNTPNYPEGKKWLTKAAEQGSSVAQSGLGWMYFGGQGEPDNTPNYPEAKKWFIKAAEQDIPKAQSNLGLMYLNGQGEPDNIPNYPEGKKWITKAAEQGYSHAQAGLGVMYCRGQGEPDNTPNYPEGKKWITKAAEQGHTGAQSDLGGMHAAGLIEDPLTEVCLWFCKTIKNAKGDNYTSKENLVAMLQKAFSSYIPKQAEQDLTDLLVNMEYITTPEEFKNGEKETFSRDKKPKQHTLSDNEKAYFVDNALLFENIARLKPNDSTTLDGVAIFAKAKETQAEQRADLQNSVDIISDTIFANLPNELQVRIASIFPKAGLPVNDRDIVDEIASSKYAKALAQDNASRKEILSEPPFDRILRERSAKNSEALKR